jgi:hypothetical protein
MATKKNNYIDFELEWLEAKAKELQQYVDDNPVTELEDRKDVKETKNGGAIWVVVATIEQQHKNIRDTLKDYSILIEAIGRLREGEAKKKMQARGDSNLSMMEEGDLDN